MPVTMGKDYKGYVIYCNDKRPIGMVSSNGERSAICSTNTLPKSLISYLTAIEDKRFYQHAGLDIRGITRAIYENIKAGKLRQGGSTITQQLARNILRDNRKSIVRKAKEISLAINIENKYSKDEILELYFNNVFWGKSIYGIRAASLEYFSKEPGQLSTAEQIALLTFLRGPNYYIGNKEKFEKRYNLLNNTLHNNRVLSSKKYFKSKKARIKISQNNLQVFRNNSVPYIAEHINSKHYSILSTLNKELQREAVRFISSCKYPTSLICISGGKVIAVDSSNGTDYPFIFRANVGSTLKPFIYTFLRENGLSINEPLSTINTHNLNWNIREVQKPNKYFLTLKEGLALSNNNAFVNASYKIGIERVLSFLAKSLNKPEGNFVPASILGATVEGITLYELASAYYRFFIEKPESPFNTECISILKEIATEKFEEKTYDVFLKTGTTNYNKERYAIVGKAKMLFAFLRQGNDVDDYSKEGNFLSNILSFLRRISKKVYKWE